MTKQTERLIAEMEMEKKNEQASERAQTLNFTTTQQVIVFMIFTVNQTIQKKKTY